jgi:hypothetical protein
MKPFTHLLLISCLYYISSCSPCMSQTKKQSTREFLNKTELDTSKDNYGIHIEVKQILPDTKEMIPMSIDDRDIIGRSKYSRDERIKILGEYLTFRGDTIASNKKYHFKAAHHMVLPEGIVGFTVEIEALYSFTRMLTVGYAPIKPMLIDCNTGEEVNTHQEKVNEVYDIYSKWYQENLKSDFKSITLPLSGSRYCWIGQDKDLKPYLKKSL